MIKFARRHLEKANIKAFAENKPHSHLDMLNFSVLAIFRNEAHILKEWIEHYLFFGAERIYLINNNSTDDYLPVLTNYIEKGLVKLFDCSRDKLELFPPKYQIGAYMELLPKLQKETKWVGVFDLDEFIYPVDGRPIPETLSIYGDYDAVLIPWLSFGSNGFVEQPPSVVNSFIRRGNAGISRAFLKSISKTSEIVLLHQHNPLTRNKKKVLSNGNPIRESKFIDLKETGLPGFRLINNHYRLQSLNYYNKIRANRPASTEANKDSFKCLSYFRLNDTFWNAIEDTRLRDILRASNRLSKYSGII